MALARQARLIRLIPLAFVSASASLALLLLFPAFFLGQHAHWILGAIQVEVAAIGLAHNARALVTWQEPIMRKTVEELAEEGD
jgi:hypothetical protein